MAIQTVNNIIRPNNPGMADAHVHAWAKFKKYKAENSFPQADDFELIKKNLSDFKKSGGDLVVDCTPCGSGRDGNKLYELYVGTGVEIVCVTGFHRREYYLSGFEIWDFNQEQAFSFFLKEITEGLTETLNRDRRIKPGLIKIPFLGPLDGVYKILTDAAIFAAIQTGVPLLIHTEQGLNVEWFCDYLEEKGIAPQKVVLCHMDKRPDIKLHEKLASKGYYLEYDTFLREKYNPEKYTYKLIDSMVKSGHGGSIMVGSDISNNDMWKNISTGSGYGGFFTKLKSRIQEGNNSSNNFIDIMGGNAVRFLSG
jgi:predicted metal-dependent phosphotriesterase family hydrolase